MRLTEDNVIPQKTTLNVIGFGGKFSHCAKTGPNPYCQELASSFIFSTVALHTYERDITIQYYSNSNHNHKKGTKCRPKTPNPVTVSAIHPKGRWVTATIVWLGFLDTALYLNQYSEDAITWQYGIGLG